MKMLNPLRGNVEKIRAESQNKNNGRLYNNRAYKLIVFASPRTPPS